MAKQQPISWEEHSKFTFGEGVFFAALLAVIVLAFITSVTI